MSLPPTYRLLLRGLPRTVLLTVFLAVVFVIFWVLPGRGAAAGQPPEGGRLSVTFFSVGYGDAILVRAPSGRTMLVDAGSAEAGPALASAIQALGVRRLDLVVATHPHPDHIGGLAAVLASLRAGRLVGYAPQVIHDIIHDAAPLVSVHTLTIRRGDQLDLGPGLRVDVLHPGQAMSGDMNDDSIVLRLLHDRVAILLTGDIGTAGQEELVSIYGGRLHSTVVKVPHHGWGGYNPTFIEAVQPRHAVISVGRHPDYPAPDPRVVTAYQEVGAAILRTDRAGTITVESDGRAVRVTTQAKARP